MNIDKERLIKNLVIYAIIAVVFTMIFTTAMDNVNLGECILGGCLAAMVFWFPVRLYPRIGLLGSIFVVIAFYAVFFAISAIPVVGAILSVIVVIAGFVASLFVM